MTTQSLHPHIVEIMTNLLDPGPRAAPTIKAERATSFSFSLDVYIKPGNILRNSKKTDGNRLKSEIMAENQILPVLCLSDCLDHEGFAARGRAHQPLFESESCSGVWVL